MVDYGGSQLRQRALTDSSAGGPSSINAAIDKFFAEQESAPTNAAIDGWLEEQGQSLDPINQAIDELLAEEASTVRRQAEIPKPSPLPAPGVPRSPEDVGIGEWEAVPGKFGRTPEQEKETKYIIEAAKLDDPSISLPPRLPLLDRKRDEVMPSEIPVAFRRTPRNAAAMEVINKIRGRPIQKADVRRQAKVSKPAPQPELSPDDLPEVPRSPEDVGIGEWEAIPGKLGRTPEQEKETKYIIEAAKLDDPSLSLYPSLYPQDSIFHPLPKADPEQFKEPGALRRLLQGSYNLIPGTAVEIYGEELLRDAVVHEWAFREAHGLYDEGEDIEQSVINELFVLGNPMWSPGAARLQAEAYTVIGKWGKKYLPSAQIKNWHDLGGIWRRVAQFGGDTAPLIAELAVLRKAGLYRLGRFLLPRYPMMADALSTGAGFGISHALEGRDPYEGFLVGTGAGLTGGLGRMAAGPAGAAAGTGAFFASQAAAQGGDPYDVMIAGILMPLMFHAKELKPEAVRGLRASKAMADRRLGGIVEGARAGREIAGELRQFMTDLATGKASLSKDGRALWRRLQEVGKEGPRPVPTATETGRGPIVEEAERAAEERIEQEGRERERPRAGEERAAAEAGRGDRLEEGREVKAEEVEKGIAAAPAEAPSPTFRQPVEMAGEPKAQVSAADLVSSMEKAAGMPFRVGHGQFRQRKAVGWFDPKRHVVRQRVANQLDVAAHEFGHAVNAKIVGWEPEWPAEVAKELSDMGRELYGERKPRGGYRREGFAEYTARLFLGDESMRDTATHRWMEDTVLPQHPEFAAQWRGIQEQFAAYNQQGAPARVASMVQKAAKGPVATIKNVADKMSAILSRRLWTTDAAPLEDAVKKVIAERNLRELRPDENPATLRAALRMSAPGTARYFIYNSAVNTRFQPVGQPLSEHLKPIRKNLDDFTVYAVAKRAQWLHQRGIEPGISEVDARSTVEQLETPEFQRALDGVTEWSNYLIDYVVDSGGLSPEAAAAVRAANPIYVPFLRYFDVKHRGGPKGRGKRGMVSQPQAIKRIKGSGRQIRDPLESFLQQAEEMISLGNKLQVAKAVAEFAEQAGESAWFAEKIPTPKEATSFRLGEIERQLETAGIELGGADLDQVLTVFDNATRYFGKDNIATIWRNGRREFWEFDPDVYRVITEMDKEVLPSTLRWIVGMPKRAVQLGATALQYKFGIRNLLRDIQTWNIYARGRSLRGKLLGPLEALQGFWDELRKSPAEQRWSAAGGRMTTLMGQDRAEARRRIDDAIVVGRLERGKYIARHPIEALRELIAAFESAPRITEFKKVLAEAEEKYGVGSRAAVVEAMLAAKDVTVNFTRMGTLSAMANQAIPFFNARIQGASKFYRTFGGKDSAAAALRATTRGFTYLTVPNIVLWWMNKDQPWYQEMEPWEKFGFLHFDTTGADDGSGVISIPGAFELQYVFGGIPTSILDEAYREDPEAVSDSVFEAFKSFLPVHTALDIIPAVLKPTVEVAVNRKSFPEIREIDPHWDVKTKLPPDRYSEWTTETAKVIGEWLNVSPRKVEHWLAGHTGGMAMDILRFSESILGLREMKSPLEGIVTRRSAIGRGASVTEFYDRLEVLRQKKGSGELAGSESAELRRFERAAQRMSRIRRQQQAGRLDDDEANWQINDIARDLLGKPSFDQTSQVTPPTERRSVIQSLGGVTFDDLVGVA